jgi:SPASM domain peptide maturase of grasp-with-spasm system
MNKYFLLYTCCLPVMGYKRSIIVDTQRQDIFFIPNSIYFALTKYKTKDIKWINDHYKTIDIYKYYDAFIREELGTYSDNIMQFPNIDLSYESPKIITNSIIVYSDKSNYDFNHIFSELETVECEAIELRIINSIPKEKLKWILEQERMQETGFTSITLILPYSNNINISQLLSSYPKIRYLCFYNYNENKVVIDDYCKIIYSNKKNISNFDCGEISINDFSPNLEMLMESQTYNNCLNQKVCIDELGNVKNCPAFNNSYGNISHVKLKDIVISKSFRKIWSIKKDDILVCKDCEFRYICQDCRAFTRNRKLNYPPVKCGYNPYIAKWKGEYGYYPFDINTLIK